MHFDDDKPALHPAVRRVMVLLDNMGITSTANTKPDGTTTITFHVDDPETFDDFLAASPATRTQQ